MVFVVMPLALHLDPLLEVTSPPFRHGLDACAAADPQAGVLSKREQQAPPMKKTSDLRERRLRTIQKKHQDRTSLVLCALSHASLTRTPVLRREYANCQQSWHHLNTPGVKSYPGAEPSITMSELIITSSLVKVQH